MIKVKESAAPARKPKAAVRKTVARRVTKAVPKRKKRELRGPGSDGIWRVPANPGSAALVIPIEPCPNCGGTGQRPRSMTAGERQRLRRARLKGGK